MAWLPPQSSVFGYLSSHPALFAPLLMGHELAALYPPPDGDTPSGGDIETAGPKDVNDVSDVINWLLANTPSDPAHLGAAGISYGSGLSLLGSAFDSRIRAAAALST
jgi:dipeptidyl aminopeptidase/acylaminoacyl peptidase